MTRNPPGKGPLDGVTILVVEDEVIIGMMLRNEIENAGGTSVGPVTSVTEALKAIESAPPDVALLDSKLVDGNAAELAAALERRKVPFAAVSGYEKRFLPESLRSAPFISKPISVPLLLETVEGLAKGLPVVGFRGRAPAPSPAAQLNLEQVRGLESHPRTGEPPGSGK